MMRRTISTMLFAIAGTAAAPGLAQAGPILHGPFSHYSVEIVSGPASVSRYNGNNVSLLDLGNELSWTRDRTDPEPMTLHREYSARFTADPGWAFTSIELGAWGGLEAGYGGSSAGPIRYTIGTASFAPISSGLMWGDYPGYYWQNPVWNFYTSFGFGTGVLPVPASSFTVAITTDIYVHAGIGSFGWVRLTGWSAYEPLATWTLSAAMREAPVSSVPEPSSLFLFAAGSAGLFGRYRRRKRGA